MQNQYNNLEAHVHNHIHTLIDTREEIMFQVDVTYSTLNNTRKCIYFRLVLNVMKENNTGEQTGPYLVLTVSIEWMRALMNNSSLHDAHQKMSLR